MILIHYINIYRYTVHSLLETLPPNALANDTKGEAQNASGTPLVGSSEPSHTPPEIDESTESCQQNPDVFFNFIFTFFIAFNNGKRQTSLQPESVIIVCSFRMFL